MCYACYMDQDEDSGEFKLPPPAPHPETDRLVELIGQLYELPECGSGGPLHSVLDDWNLNFETITPGHFTSHYGDDEGRYTSEALAVCDEIAAIMNRMTEDQRAYALAIHEDFIPTGD